ncbi:MAG: AAA family ATPase [SAR324 cluster bacterium]|nr:AAA family ATPase [SAR324 cluster bacterium]
MGLLHLARQGTLEAAWFRPLPSVLIQQILSCLYEKKQITLPSLINLFPEQASTLEQLVFNMQSQGWFRAPKTSKLQGLMLSPAWRYRDFFLERKIWSNFPEAEEEYSLELSQEALADLPLSLVKQLKPGDRVQLAGKYLQIMEIDHGEHKRVQAQPSKTVDDRELIWLGTGMRGSWEVAQAIHELFQTVDIPEFSKRFGLFDRTRSLLQTELERYQKVVTLANGIQVNRTREGFWRYWTFLGALGNLILQWVVEHHPPFQELENFSVTSDELGVTCSHEVDFGKLKLPLDRDQLRIWVQQHESGLRNLFALNEYWQFLPGEFQLSELCGFVTDDRLLTAYRNYHDMGSDIVKGEASWLEFNSSSTISQPPQETPHWPVAENLLETERERWRKQLADLAGHQSAVAQPATPDQSGVLTITGTLLSEYLRHQQCQLWLDWNFRKIADADAPFSADSLQEWRLEQGQLHEAKTLGWLEEHHPGSLLEMPDTGDQRRLSLQQRFTLFWNVLKQMETGGEEPVPRYIAHPVLRFAQEEHLEWIGIPDLLRISRSENQYLLEIGDIKHSRQPHYGHKWQIAFYAHVLRKLLIHANFQHIQVANTGFLLTRPPKNQAEPVEHLVDLIPYLATMPVLLRNMTELANHSPSTAQYFMQPHCDSCPFFTRCYAEALTSHEIQFLPGMSPGVAAMLQQQQIQRFHQFKTFLEQSEALFSPQKQRFSNPLVAMTEQQIRLKQSVTRQFPGNLDFAIFVHLSQHPSLDHPLCLGWKVWNVSHSAEQHSPVFEQNWILTSLEEWNSLWNTFSADFSRLWHTILQANRIPHVFYFNASVWQGLQTFKCGNDLDYLWHSLIPSHTDLQSLLRQHFDWPVPGTLSLSSLQRILGWPSTLQSFNTDSHLFQETPIPRLLLEYLLSGQISGQKHEPMEASHPLKQAEQWLETILVLELDLWKWLTTRIKSQWYPASEELPGAQTESLSRNFRNFVEREKQEREDAVLNLQQRPLPERVELFRAAGPLHWKETTLDDEGRFLYCFQAPENQVSSKFREGDFLKLPALGIADLQEGWPVILMRHDPVRGEFWLRSRQGKLMVHAQARYSLDEDITDWNSAKLIHAIETVFETRSHRPLKQLLEGHVSGHPPREVLNWVEQWLKEWNGLARLNSTQQTALKLPFTRNLSLIEGPPGTGKTHLLGWILIALIQQAQACRQPLRIVVSALTHQAIDQVLEKVVSLVQRHGLPNFPAKIYKWGRMDSAEEEPPAWRVQPLSGKAELEAEPYVILGATGFGLYQLFGSQSGEFPGFFDWVVFDEASQMLLPQALLALLYGREQFLFVGDTRQLPPIILGNYKSASSAMFPAKSILAHLLERYPDQAHVRLNLTYRMNDVICEFPSRLWYEGELRPDVGNARSRLSLKSGDFDELERLLDPEHPVTLVLMDHQNCVQTSVQEAELVSKLARRLLSRHQKQPEDIAIISPHRAQNNSIRQMLQKMMDRLPENLPVIDTVERMQGAERDIILFSLTASDPDSLESPFLNDPNRLNVVLTRARHKLVMIGSVAFFRHIPSTEDALRSHACFKQFLDYCTGRNSVFYLNSENSLEAGS